MSLSSDSKLAASADSANSGCLQYIGRCAPRHLAGSRMAQPAGGSAMGPWREAVSPPWRGPRLPPEGERAFSGRPSEGSCGECLDAGDRAPQDQRVDVVRAFVGVDHLQVDQVARDAELVADAVATHHVARQPAGVLNNLCILHTQASRLLQDAGSMPQALLSPRMLFQPALQGVKSSRGSIGQTCQQGSKPQALSIHTASNGRG